MLKIFYTFLASILLLSCAAQRTDSTKILAYRQVLLGGPAPPVMTDEKGNPKEIPMKERAEYFIYIVSAPTNIKVVDLWVRKDHYSASTQEVVTPVVITNTTMIVNARPDTLVKKMSGKVLQVFREPSKDGVKPSQSLQKKINDNELVLHYIVNGKDYYYTVPAIKNLSPVALQ